MFKHGGKGSRLFGIWGGMKQRCSNPRRERWAKYGGRGIKVCVQWEKSFESFRDWAMANGYADSKTIDRRDNDADYCPDNCRWVDGVDQARNKSTSRKITFDGQTLTVIEWAKRTGINYSTLQWRYSKGLSVEQMLAPCGGKIREG